VRATEAAAIRAYPFVGRGDKNGADGAAVDAMRTFLATVDFAGVVVIGEGEKDEAPMLFNGEEVGTGDGPACDIAVDPIDGTSLTASGRRNAISMIAAADRGSMLDASSVFYMDKLVAGPEAVGLLDLRMDVAEIVAALSGALGKTPGELRVGILDRPRHEDLVAQVRAAGATTRLLLDGDVGGGIEAAGPGGGLDLCLGIGGSPEGVATACAVKALGGFIQTRLAPRDDDERRRGEAAGLRFGHVYEADELVASDNTFFVATGVTDGSLVGGVRRHGRTISTESIVLRSRSGTVRRISADHLASRWIDAGATSAG
jgi:fructose-1,6-bisphosphatase II